MNFLASQIFITMLELLMLCRIIPRLLMPRISMVMPSIFQNLPQLQFCHLAVWAFLRAQLKAHRHCIYIRRFTFLESNALPEANESIDGIYFQVCGFFEKIARVKASNMTRMLMRTQTTYQHDAHRRQNPFRYPASSAYPPSITIIL